MPDAVIPEALAVLIEHTGQKLVEDYALLSGKLILQDDVDEVLKGHARNGQALLNFVARSREQGKVV